MNREDLIKEINRLRLMRYTWKQIQLKLFKDPNPPSIPSLQRWAKGEGPVYCKAYPIPPEHQDEVRRIFIKQLKKMGFNSSEIKKELKKLIL